MNANLPKMRCIFILLLLLLLLGTIEIEGEGVSDPWQGTERGYAAVQGGESAMFYWLFPAEGGVEPQKTPLILWLEGGPGIPGLFTVFFGPGPYRLSSPQRFTTSPDPANITVLRNPYSWTSFASMLFVDNPIGVGFSYTNNSRLYAKNQSQVAQVLLEFLQVFFARYPDYASCPLHLAGHSYGGKYILGLATALQPYIASSSSSSERDISSTSKSESRSSPLKTESRSSPSKTESLSSTLKSERSASFQVNLKSIIDIDGLVDPIAAAQAWIPYGQTLGFLSPQGSQQAAEGVNKLIELMEAQQYEQAAAFYFDVILAMGALAGVSVYDTFPLQIDSPLYLPSFYGWQGLANTTLWRQQLNVYPRALPPGAVNRRFALPFNQDIARPYQQLLAPLLQGPRAIAALVVNGNADWIIATSGVRSWLASSFALEDGRTLSDVPAARWCTASSDPVTWPFNVTAAAVQTLGPLTLATVHQSGHYFGWSVPKQALALMQDWIADLSLDTNPQNCLN